MWKIMYVFFNLKPYKHIVLHQIHKMLFLATSADLFKYIDYLRFWLQ